MDGQLNIFDCLNSIKTSFKPGEWVEECVLGKEITFQEITERVGKLIIIDMSTVSHAWYKIVKVEKIIPYEGMRRLIYYDGCKQRGLVNEQYFDKETQFMSKRAWDIKK